ncbi:MAG: hypothetical protein V1875_06930 [Candidatus Altiarchaeota archaeon]
MAGGPQSKVEEANRRLKLQQQRQEEDRNIVQLEHRLMDRRVETLLFGKATDQSMLLPALNGRRAAEAFVDIHQKRKLEETVPKEKSDEMRNPRTDEKPPKDDNVPDLSLSA